MRCAKEPCEVQKLYKAALQKLLEKKDLESVFFFRVMMETGMRPNDVYHLRPADIADRRIIKRSLKNNKLEEYPLISKRTEQIVRTLLRDRCYFFHRHCDVYKIRIRRSFSESSKKLIYLRHYRLDMEEKILMKKQKRNQKRLAAL